MRTLPSPRLPPARPAVVAGTRPGPRRQPCRQALRLAAWVLATGAPFSPVLPLTASVAQAQAVIAEPALSTALSTEVQRLASEAAGIVWGTAAKPPRIEVVVGKLDPRLKLVLTIAYIVLLFAASNPLGLALSILFLAAMYKVAKIPGKMILKSLKPILPIVIFTAVLNLFFVSGEGEPLVHIWFLTIYAEGVRYAVLMAVRVMALIAGTSLLTYTTSPIVLTDAIEQLLKPLGKLHFPVHELAMMMSIALRFIPTLIEETDKIMNAQKARGAQLDTGKMTDRVKALVPVLIPLFISAFRRADELAMAMECRCYRGGDGRTRLKVLRCEKQDYIDLAVCIACFAVILASRLVFPNF